MFWDTIGMSYHCVVLVEAPHTIHFIVDAAGDVLNVLHMGSEKVHKLRSEFIAVYSLSTIHTHKIGLEEKHSQYTITYKHTDAMRPGCMKD